MQTSGQIKQQKLQPMHFLSGLFLNFAGLTPNLFKLESMAINPLGQ
jgi:hypothetical protein